MKGWSDKCVGFDSVELLGAFFHLSNIAVAKWHGKGFSHCEQTWSDEWRFSQMSCDVSHLAYVTIRYLWYMGHYHCMCSNWRGKHTYLQYSNPTINEITHGIHRGENIAPGNPSNTTYQGGRFAHCRCASKSCEKRRKLKDNDEINSPCNINHHLHFKLESLFHLHNHLHLFFGLWRYWY